MRDKLRFKEVHWRALWSSLILGSALLASPAAHANTYVYDAIGRLEKVTYPDGSTVTYTYDDAGNRTQKVTTGVAGANFVVDDVSVTEGASLTFSVRRNGDNTAAVSVDYASANVTAAAPTDYTSVSGTFSYAAGERVKSVTVTSGDDTTYESDETFNFNLSNPSSGTTITDGLGVGTLVNDDNGPPNAVNNSYSLANYSGLNMYVLGNDSDPDSDPLTITSVTNPANGVVTIKASGTYLRILSTDPGTETFTYTISDGNGGTDTATVTVTVTGGGGPPL